MATYYINNTLWADTDATGTATGGGADYILLKAATSQSDDAFNNWGIYIVSGTGLGQSRRIIDYVQTGHGSGERYAQVDAAWSVNPDATSVYEIVKGSDQNNGLSADEYGGTNGAWYLPSYTADQVAASDIVHIKGGRDYAYQDGANNSVMQCTTAGAQGSPVTFSGYTTTPGDGGQATFNAGTNGLASGINGTLTSWYHVFKNIRCTGGSADGFNLNSTAGDFVTLVNCRGDNNTAYGLQGDNWIIMIKCMFDNNSSGGVDVDSYSYANTSAYYTNSGDGIHVTTQGDIISCLFYENGANNNIYVNGDTCTIVGNSIDGDNTVGSIGIKQDAATFNGLVITNNILYDLGVGIELDGDMGEIIYSDYNLFFSNTTDRTNVMTGDNDVAGSSDPFTDSASNDYTLKTASEALDAGIDAGEIHP